MRNGGYIGVRADKALRLLGEKGPMRYLKSMLLEALHATGKVKTARVTVSIRTTQAVEVSEGADLPEAYTTVKTTVSPNKVAIKQALLDGVEVPGCHIEERESVQIR